MKSVITGLAKDAGKSMFADKVRRRLVRSALSTDMNSQRFAQEAIKSKGKKFSKNSESGTLLDNAKILAVVGGSLALPITMQYMSMKNPEIEGELIKNNGKKDFVYDKSDFDVIGTKELGRNPGSIIYNKQSGQKYVSKSVPSEGALWEEVLSAVFVSNVMGEENSPRNIVVQTPKENGKATYEVASQIMGQNNEGEDVTKNLEQIFSDPAYESKLKKAPLVNHGVSLLLDAMLGKQIDIKLANQVAFKKGDGKSCVYPIDHEQGDVTKAVRFGNDKVMVLTDSKKLVELFNDLNPKKAVDLRNRVAAGIDTMGEFDNAKDNMPLFASVKANDAYDYLLNDLQNNKEEQQRVKQAIQKIAMFSKDDIENMIEASEDLSQVVPTKIKDNFKGFVNRVQKSCAEYIEKNSEQFLGSQKDVGNFSKAALSLKNSQQGRG